MWRKNIRLPSLPNMRVFSRLLIFSLFYLAFLSPALAQSKTDLEKKRKKLLQDIELTTQLLNKTKERKANSLNELVTLKKRINIRLALIENISAEISLLSENIIETNSIITSLENDLEALKKEYAKMIYYSYKHHSAYNRLLFLFSAENFNDAFYRMRYMKRYAEFRKKQAIIIEETQKNLIGKITNLEEKKISKQKLLETENTQKETLNLERKEQNEVFSKLQTEEKKLLSDLKKKQKNANKLNKAIEDIIKRELAEARRKAEEAAKEASAEAAVKGVNLALTPEAAKLSAGFSSNRGKLPWPVERGVIIGTFGKHKHPVLETVWTENNGIDIKTHKGATARVLFEGTVANIVFNPGFHKAVIVRHGDYFTVYSNLDEVFVKPGDVVKVKHPLGVVYTDEAEAKTEIHLEVWKGTTKLNPEYWIYKD